MNRAYKLVWNTVSASWVVASELAKGRKKSSSTALKLAVLVAAGIGAGMANAAPAANALPSGESIASGSATFDRTVANQLTVNQGSSKLITNWNSFDVGSGATVQFAQPDASSIALNRVTSGSASEIFGQVTANGQLVLVNPNGITFGAGSQVSAASIIGSVMDIQDSDFNAGTLLFSRGSATGTIDNQGSLTGTAGSVSLLAPTVKNSGTITATGGNAALINADAVNLTAADPSVTTASSITGLIQQSGGITATQVSSVGGKILLTGDTSQAASQIQLAGTLDASTNTNINGRSILVNGDVNLNGASNVLDLTSTDGYSLTNAAAVNLNGASSGFSVNGTAYTVIRNVTQLQDMNTNLTGKYVLASDIDASDTVNWNSGAGFVPVGNADSEFIGVLDGLGHEIKSLRINLPTTDSVGLIGYAYGAKLQNIGLVDNSITGNTYVGSLAGYIYNSSIRNSYNSGGVTGNSYVGGLLGYGSASFGGRISISNSYNNGSVSGNSEAGGLLGYGSATFGNSSISISNSYNSGNVSGNSNVGGLLGYGSPSFDNSSISISNSYNSGNVSGNSNAGGLLGYGSASFGNSSISISNSYWNIDAWSGAGVGSGILSAGSNPQSLTSSQFKQLSSFSSWGSDIDAQGGTGTVWRIYDGQTGPLLRSFLNPLKVADYSKTYDATAYAGALPSGFDNGKVFGTASYSGSAIDAVNAGNYSQTVSGLYSLQNGYDIVDTGKLTINKASLSISATDASKVYDGTTNATASTVISGGSLFGTDTISGGSFAFADKHAGTGKHVLVSGVTVNDGNNGGNYDITYVDNTNSSISKRQLTISAVADSKEYDGKQTSSAKPVVTGRVRGDAIVGLTQSYLDKNAGTGKTINVGNGYTIRDGNNGNNYDVVIVNSNAGVITPKALSISTVANTKVYDGGVTSANKPVVTGLLSGDRIIGLFQQYETKTVGENKKLLIKNGYVVQDGNSGGNYSITEQGSMDGVITAH